MSGLDAVFAALGAGDADAARKSILEQLAAPATGPDTIELAFEVGDWLFEQGHTEAGSEVYLAAFRKVEVLGTAPRFELARRLDGLARHLIKAGRLEGAAEALKGSIALSQSGADIDVQAFEWRFRQLRDINATIGGPEMDRKANADETKPAKKSATREVSARIDKANVPPPAMKPAAAGAPAPAPQVESADGMRYRKVTEALETVPDSDKYYKVPVHFATHRNPNADSEDTCSPYDLYGHEPSEHLNFGRAIVTVPAQRIVGRYEEPSTGWFGNGGELDKSFTVQVINVLPNQQVVIGEVSDIIAGSRKKEMLVFLHGYRTTLTSGLMRAAQLKVDMKIDGAVVLYSLPSKGTILGYGHDRINAESAKAHEHLRDFLNALCANTGATRIHLVAHSLGCEMLIRSLNEMWKMDGASPKRRFDEIVFGAPDVDHQGFCDLVPRITALCRRVTVYASDRDIPLALIGRIVQRDRAGFDASRLAGIAGVESIDTTDGTSWFGSLFDQWGHWDFADESIDDIRAVVWLSLNPSGRRSRIAERKRADGAGYWAVEKRDSATLAIFRKALEWARELGVDAALTAAKNGEAAERAMSPPGAMLAEFEQLHKEIALFSGTLPQTRV